MRLFSSNIIPICPANQHCAQWARDYMNYCLCNKKDWISLILGLISVLSWSVAEVPQIIMNYKDKSSEGLAMGLLFTWILGDLFNVLGCLLEPSTLPTQYYTAVMYLLTTLALSSQSTYYGYFYRDTSKLQLDKIGSVDKKQLANSVSLEESTVPVLSKVNPSLRNPSKCDLQDPIQEPLLGGYESRQSRPASKTKNTLCVVFTLTVFLCTYNLKLERDSYLNSDSVNSHNGIVLQVGRKLLQFENRHQRQVVSGSLSEGSEGIESNGVGTYLGWGMAAIYMGARLPQICLNFRRGSVKGLNPLLFIFALVGNSTYLASILVSSLEWSKIQPNLPWVVESSGCIMLDTFLAIFQALNLVFHLPKLFSNPPNLFKRSIRADHIHLFFAV
ncbi:hypothetical protein QVD17_22456 [Tagetes erecta]|uniref:PQ-loop repeat family protein / transmembrane family protein n=1 Tax=Tagetes erecta TaxID=13708 RepID=A0AAD8KGJ9_TARER|nr:hypothetical protein QVD17_22456 [Tagetes erecta]